MSISIVPDFTQSARELAPQTEPKEMLSVTRDGNSVHVRINSSSLSILQSCARKSYYLLNQNWRAKAGSPPLVFGHAIHKALEVFYLWPRAAREIPVNFEEYAALMAHGHPAPEPLPAYDAIASFVKDASPLATLPDTDKRSLASGIWTLCHYMRTYLHDSYVTYIDRDGPFIERKFSVPLLDTKEFKVELFGTIDFALKNEATGELLVGDYKTSSQLGSNFLNRIKPNHQYTGYVIGAQSLGVASENFMVNGIQVKARPLTAHGGPPTFIRQITKRTAQDILEFKHAVGFAVSNYLAWEGSGIWPLGSVDSCAMWGGCSFLDVCSAPNALRNNILESKYTKDVHATK